MTPPLTTDFKGNWLDRLSGLFHSMDYAGKSVLDAGCHCGIVLYEISKKNPKFLRGVDIVPFNIQIADEILSHTGIPYEVNVANLARQKDLKSSINRSYDVSLVLATYHHVKRVYGSDIAVSALAHVCAHTREALVFRGPDDRGAQSVLLTYGFKEEKVILHRKIHPLTIWKK